MMRTYDANAAIKPSTSNVRLFDFPSKSVKKSVTLVDFAFFQRAASLGDITQGPLNDAALAGNDVVLNCESTTTGLERVQFVEYQTNPNGAVISDGATLLPGHPNYFRHELTTDVDAGSYSLKIRTTILEDGGKYACRDINALPTPTTWYSDLVILGTLNAICVFFCNHLTVNK
jgi:hypothetical protein